MEQQHDKENQGDLLLDMCNNEDLELTLLAGSNIAARQRMAQALPLEMQLYMAPAVQQGLTAAKLKVNWVEMSRRSEEATGWKSQEDVIIPMTPQDQQQAMASNPKIIDAKATRDRLEQMHQNKTAEAEQGHQHKVEQIDAKGLADTGKDVLTKSLERAQVREEEPQFAAALSSLGGGS
jgi:hypothetical protein